MIHKYNAKSTCPQSQIFEEVISVIHFTTHTYSTESFSSFVDEQEMYHQTSGLLF